MKACVKSHIKSDLQQYLISLWYIKMCLSCTTRSVNMAYWHIVTELLTSSTLRYRRPFCRIYKMSTKKLLHDIGYAS